MGIFYSYISLPEGIRFFGFSKRIFQPLCTLSCPRWCTWVFPQDLFCNMLRGCFRFISACSKNQMLTGLAVFISFSKCHSCFCIMQRSLHICCLFCFFTCFDLLLRSKQPVRFVWFKCQVLIFTFCVRIIIHWFSNDHLNFSLLLLNWILPLLQSYFYFC